MAVAFCGRMAHPPAAGQGVGGVADGRAGVPLEQGDPPQPLLEPVELAVELVLGGVGGAAGDRQLVLQALERAEGDGVGGERLVEAAEDLGHPLARRPLALARLVVGDEVEREEALLEPDLGLVGGGSDSGSRRRRRGPVLGSRRQRQEKEEREGPGCGRACHEVADSSRVGGPSSPPGEAGGVGPPWRGGYLTAWGFNPRRGGGPHQVNPQGVACREGMAALSGLGTISPASAWG